MAQTKRETEKRSTRNCCKNREKNKTKMLQACGIKDERRKRRKEKRSWEILSTGFGNVQSQTAKEGK
jgi:hypothetical protein